jgi:hypothetical protein
MLFLLPLSPLWWWPLGLPFGAFPFAAFPFGGLAGFTGIGAGTLGAPMLLGIPLSLTSMVAYAVVFIGMGLLARRALNA